jgi:hypothetical protein
VTPEEHHAEADRLLAEMRETPANLTPEGVLRRSRYKLALAGAHAYLASSCHCRHGEDGHSK